MLRYEPQQGTAPLSLAHQMIVVSGMKESRLNSAKDPMIPTESDADPRSVTTPRMVLIMLRLDLKTSPSGDIRYQTEETTRSQHVRIRAEVKEASWEEFAPNEVRKSIL